MRLRFFALCAVPAMMALASPASAQGGFAFPSCLSSLPSGPGGQLDRLVPAEAKGPLARQVRGVVARAVTSAPTGAALLGCLRSAFGTAAVTVMTMMAVTLPPSEESRMHVLFLSVLPGLIAPGVCTATDAGDMPRAVSSKLGRHLPVSTDRSVKHCEELFAPAPMTARRGPSRLSLRGKLCQGPRRRRSF